MADEPAPVIRVMRPIRSPPNPKQALNHDDLVAMASQDVQSWSRKHEGPFFAYLSVDPADPDPAVVAVIAVECRCCWITAFGSLDGWRMDELTDNPDEARQPRPEQP